jgi:WD40 repeat protein
MSNNPTVKKILILAANPKNTVRLRLDQEVRDIEQGLQLAAQRDKFTLQQKWAVRSRDIRLAVLDFRPNIIHFSGHGSETEGLSFEDEVGKEKFVTADALGGLFKLFANHVECVLLNACYSEVQANAIAQHIDYVIGMNQAIADKAALEFAVGFYDALARYDPQYDGDSTIEFAFNIACSSISLAGVSGASIPVLIKNPNPRKRNERGDHQLLGQLIGDVPNLPPHFLRRDEQLNPLKNKVLADTNQPVAITAKNRSVGVQGMGGIGKTVLATALARDEEVRRAFPDGVIWITFGQTPQILTLQSDVVEALGDKQASFTEINSGKTQLRKLLTDKACLLILDDVWNLNDASAFDVLEKPCQMLITTRDAGIITALGGEEYQLSILSQQQALALLANWANQAVETLTTTAKEVARECGYLPLALSMVGAMMRGKPTNRWQNVLEKLRCADLEKIRQQFPDYPYPDLLKAIQVSVEALEPQERERYLDFAVFPEDTTIPEAVLQTFWEPLGLDEFDTQDVIDKLVSKSLVSRDEKGNLSLHDLQLDYVRKQVTSENPTPNPSPQAGRGKDATVNFSSQAGRGKDATLNPSSLAGRGGEAGVGFIEGLGFLHNRLLNAYTQKYPSGWHSLKNDGYIFQNLAHHLIQAGRTTELQQLLLDFRWLQAKLENSSINELIADYNLLPEDANLQLLRRTLLLSGHVLAEDKRQLAGQLWGRLQCFAASEIQELLQQAHLNQTTRLRPLTASLTTPDGNLIRTLTGHTSWVNAIALSVDGKYLISGSSDITIKVWDWQTGVEVRTLTGHTSSVHAIALSVDGKYLISGSGDSTLKVWDWQTGVEVRTLTGHTDRVYAIAFSVDGKYLISGSVDTTLKVWNCQTGVEVRILTGHTGSVNAIAFSVDGKYLISGSGDTTLKVWDWQTGVEVRTLTGHTSAVYAIAFSPDGKYIISGSRDFTIKVWDWQIGVEVRTLTGHSHWVNAIAISPDGKYLVSGSRDFTFKVWDWQTGVEVRTLSGYTSFIKAIAISPDGKYIISSSGDTTLKVWDWQNRVEERTLTGHTSWVNAIAFSVDGKYLISGSYDTTIKVWDWQTAVEVRTLTGHTSSVYAIAISPDGKYLISGSDDTTLKVWDWQNRVEERTLTGHTSAVYAIAFSPDGKYIISCSDDSKLKVWDWQAEVEVRTLTGHTSGVNAIAFSPDGKYLVSGSYDTTLKVWDWQTGVEVRTIQGHNSRVYAIAFSPDGKYLVSSSDDNTVKVWDWQTEVEVRTLTSHTSGVHAIAFSPDGKYLISGSDDSKLKVWDWQAGEVIATFTGDSSIHCCAVAKDRLTIVAGDESGRLHFLRLEGV